MTQRERYYQKRIGKVYGTYRVVAVEYDEKAENHQLWTCECINCGRIVKTRHGKDMVKGRSGKTCECMLKKNNRPKAQTYAEKMQVHQGEIISDWKIVEYEEGRGFLCECVFCKRLSYKHAKTLLEGRAPKCICRPQETKYDEEWIGRKFNHLTIVGVSHKKSADGHTRIYFDCVCDCGNNISVRPIYLIKGQTKCCGNDCKFKNENTKLKVVSAKHPLYKKLQSMKSRCENQTNPSYECYGGRGIKVCDEWKGRQGFYNFYKWSMENGWKDGLTIDRINPDGDYEPNNCRYITLKENVKLARKPYTLVGYKGYERKTKNSDVEVVIDGYMCDIKTATVLSGISYQRARYCVDKKGMTWQEAFDFCIAKEKHKQYIFEKYGIK